MDLHQRNHILDTLFWGARGRRYSLKKQPDSIRRFRREVPTRSRPFPFRSSSPTTGVYCVEVGKDWWEYRHCRVPRAGGNVDVDSGRFWDME